MTKTIVISSYDGNHGYIPGDLISWDVVVYEGRKYLVNLPTTEAFRIINDDGKKDSVRGIRIKRESLINKLFDQY